ncbi:conserved hypothetical protein [Abyssogena phaseoliformis symbiont OG214]|uniref:YgaP family membrane protein n=1 Tax=unclassified Gammaproteobacteria TaxID=33811 RepID=UPI0019162F9A|nr:MULTISPECIES: DUF2892 domain-containing protein [unclassified Gammaproteobacteria]MBW5289437.1 hypothetical protein [Candidatus Ruthia sp. Apha_13_S6]MBW5290648.1 hypothetical protein [Candidatus Ruthia sp. Asou_11_S2]BBB22345.1 conserved hypothetical protein [Abyssogena phaseoliformis symbiont OG214]BBB24114.1 conserved hypothetical protein [Isorropodon fossajaponicum endosymbiont JTNG4]
MTVNNVVSAMAGVIIMISLLLGAQAISPFAYNSNWLWLTAFVGFNLFQSAFTGFCPAAIIAKKLGAK